MKKRTIKEISDELNELYHQVDSRDYLFQEYPEFVQAKKEYLEARNRFIEVEKKYQSQVNIKKTEILAKIEKLNIEAGVLKRKKNEIPAEFNKWLNTEYNKGVDYGAILELVWVSEDNKYGIVRRKGHRAWSGVGMTSYNPTAYWGVEIGGKKRTRITKEHEGRLTPEVKEKMIHEMITGTGEHYTL